jgi:hypothetical protein
MNDPQSPGTSIATLSSLAANVREDGPAFTVINGIRIYAPGIAPVYVVPSLGVELKVSHSLLVP